MTYFDEYIRAAEPSKKQRADHWQTAIGLQAVDGLRVLISPSAEWQQDVDRMKEQAPNKRRTSTEQVKRALGAGSESPLRLITAIGNGTLSVKEMLQAVELKHRPTFLQNYLRPALEAGFVTMLYPQSPNSPRQKYLLTLKGITLCNTKQ